MKTINEDNSIQCCIKEISVWNSLMLFHVTDNPVVDPTQDLLEGVCH